jgi:hypothetical protein
VQRVDSKGIHSVAQTVASSADESVAQRADWKASPRVARLGTTLR